MPKLLPSNWTLDNGQGVAISHTNQHPVSKTIPKQTTVWTAQQKSVSSVDFCKKTTSSRILEGKSFDNLNTKDGQTLVRQKSE